MNKSAASRPRRAPQTELKPPPGILKSDVNNNNVRIEKSPKISIGDAIGLITIRLCKLEDRLFKDTNSDGNDTTHVLKTILDRLTELESNNKTINDNIDTLNINNSMSSGSIPSFNNLEINPNDVEIEKLKLEVDDIKKLLIKLQEKLLDIITTK
jgi:hypothetical protein